jgi:hypothetical protein
VVLAFAGSELTGSWICRCCGTTNLSAKAEQNTQHEYWQAPAPRRHPRCATASSPTSVPVKTRLRRTRRSSAAFQTLVARPSRRCCNWTKPRLSQQMTPRLARNAEGEIVTNNYRMSGCAENSSDDTWRQIVTAMTNLNFGVDENGRRARKRNLSAILR